MKKVPAQRERKRASDKFEMEHHADLQMRMSDFDARLRAHEEKHDPLNEFTKRSLTRNPDGPADITVEISGVSGHGKVGSIHVIDAIPGRFTFDAHSKKPPPAPLSLLGDAERFVALLADPKSRKKSLKRIADEEAELQVLFAEGRTRVVLWRKLNLLGWLITLFAAHYVLPVLRSIKKLFWPIWTLIVWLTS